MTNIKTALARVHLRTVRVEQPDRYILDSRPFAFALPVAHADRWGDLADRIVFGSTLAPGDWRWDRPTVLTGDVDASVAFAVGVALVEVSS